MHLGKNELIKFWSQRSVIKIIARRNVVKKAIRRAWFYFLIIFQFIVRNIRALD